ncbi:unnamed protein product [Notodromas monacha]|uniref:Uncharacterized protein n=1 Tax=Notodromas monacha TaxID=399045 RepID=A0A7R9BJV5_9CRUS|nr:unnamed protein product [Notodromas monacha]CAG0915456.1 unnamed protein product [Notodromas monacha]
MSSVGGSLKDGMDGQGDQMSETKRKSRNMSEKKRRDQFNSLINDLAAMVSPLDSKLDKSSVLKAAVSFLKSQNASEAPSKNVDISEAWKPPALSNEEFIHLMLEAVDGFLISVASDGEILHTSDNIVSILGHLPSDIINNSIFGMLYSTEAPDVYRRLANSMLSLNDDTEDTGDSFAAKQDSMSPPSSCLHLDQTCPSMRNLTVADESNDGDLAEPRIDVDFSCHFKRYSLSSNLSMSTPTFEKLKVRGFFKNCHMPSAVPRDADGHGEGKPDSLSRRRNGKNCVDGVDGLEKRRILIAAGQLGNPQLVREMPPLVDTIKGEFVSRHSLEWKFLFLDHRASPIIGYLPFELLGTSGYDYYHFDDLERISESHETLMETGDGQSCCYRFLTKGQEYIWLQSSYYISYHQWTAKPEFIVCTNRVVSYAEVRAENEREQTCDQNDLESVASLNTYRSSPAFSSEASSYCTNRTGSIVGEQGSTKRMKSPSSTASSVVNASTSQKSCSASANKQHNLLTSVVGALIEETRLAAAAQASTTFRKSKSAIVTRGFNDADIEGFREPFAYQNLSQKCGLKHAHQLGCKRVLSPPPGLRPSSGLLSPLIARSFSRTPQESPSENLSFQVPYRSTSFLENNIEHNSISCALTTKHPTAELLTAYEVPLTTSYIPASEEGMYFIQQPDNLTRQLVQPHFIQVPIVSGIIPGMSYVTTKDGRPSRLVLKTSEGQSFPCIPRTSANILTTSASMLTSGSSTPVLEHLFEIDCRRSTNPDESVVGTDVIGSSSSIRENNEVELGSIMMTTAGIPAVVVPANSVDHLGSLRTELLDPADESLTQYI